MSTFTSRVLAFAYLCLAALSAQAQSTPAVDLQVKVTVLPTCRTSTATTPTAAGSSDIDFGNQDSDAVSLEKSGGSGTAGISVTCSNTTPYVVKLTPSNNNTAGAGVLTGPGAAPSNPETIAYQLRQATGLTAAVWGNTGVPSPGSIGNSVAGTGTGAAQGYQVFATIAAIGGVAPGVYQDTVTVVVTY